MKRVTITGGLGFSGAHLVKEIINTTDWYVIIIDCLTYAGNLSRIKDLPKDRIKIIHHDITQPFLPNILDELKETSYIFHLAAATAVPRSFKNPEVFVDTNIFGTLNVLEMARELRPGRFIYVSTDEVLGQSFGQSFKETDPPNPSSPYAASKAAAELLCYSYFRSFGLPIIITRTCNMFGEMQDTEKFVPMTIAKTLRGEQIIIHTNELGVIGSREWIHASDQANALLFLLENGKLGETYQISGDKSDNLAIAYWIAKYLKAELNWTAVNIFNQFAGHDLHYSINDDKIRSLGWKPKRNFYEAMEETVLWSEKNREWLK